MENYIINVIVFIPWIVLWAYFYWGGPRTTTLPEVPALKRNSIATLISITLFYTVLHWHNELTPGLPSYEAGYALTLLGMVFIMAARYEMRSLSGKEVLFALNPNPSTGGIYAVTRHPMYIGFFMVFIGAFLLIPIVYALPFLLPILFFIYRKARVENAAHSQNI